MTTATRWVQPGETGLDFSYSKPPPKRVKELGHTFVVGYSSHNPAKNCTNPQAYIDEGLAYIDVYELDATRPNQGYNAGAADGKEHVYQARLKGVPSGQGLAIVAAVDTNTTPTNVHLHRAYLEGYGRNLAPYYDPGGYMDTDCAAAYEYWTLGWLPNAWSWSGRTRAEGERKARALGYHVFQYKGYAIDNTWNVDPNVCVRPFRAWGNPLPPTQPPGDTMTYLGTNQEPRKHTDGNTYNPGIIKYVVGTRKRHLSLPAGVPEEEGEWVKVWKREPGTPLLNAVLDAIPDEGVESGGGQPLTDIIFQGTGRIL